MHAAQLPQGVEHLVDRLAGEVGLDDVPRRVHRRTAQAHDVHRARLRGQDLEHAVDDAVVLLGAQHPQSEHRSTPPTVSPVPVTAPGARAA